MKLEEAKAQGLDGLELFIPVNSWHQLRGYLERLVHAGIVRCNSPERDALCDNPAIQVFWNDQAEWYCCCGEHYIGGQQFSGGTRWHGSRLSVLVIPELTIPWLKEQSSEFKTGMRGKWYHRET